MKIVKNEGGIVYYQGQYGLIFRDSTEYYRQKGWSHDHNVDVFCPHCEGYLAHFPTLNDASNANIDGFYTCQYGHVFCSKCAPDWHKSGEPYCPICQDAAQERFFATLQERGLDAALAKFDPTASQQALYRACRERGIDVVLYKGNIYPVRGNGDSLVFDTVSLYRGYLPFLSKIFFVNDEELQELRLNKINTPQDFARVVEHRVFDTWAGGAGFGTFVVFPRQRGWVYATLSGRRLYFIPDPYSPGYGSLYCTGLYSSIDFRSSISSFFGVPRRDSLPEIGEIVWVERPYRKGDGTVCARDNRIFWEMAK